jgi:hypothetical protein
VVPSIVSRINTGDRWAHVTIPSTDSVVEIPLESVT